MVLSMERWVGKVAIVTGASTGIGAAIAEKLVSEGLIVVGLARRSEKIEELSKKLSDAKGKLYAFKTDLTKEEDIKDAFDWTTKNVGPVHILINNAGIHLRENLIDGNTDTWRKTLDVNVLALCIASREAIKIMRENNINGHIIHINSICGHKIINLPKMDIYTASKYAVTAITDTMRGELATFGTKIKVTSISPGAVDTPIFDDIRGTEAFKEHIGQTILNPEDIADAVGYVLSTAPHVQTNHDHV
ncbi:unnamed protein product [Callosobruchus maculatus]|uniref:Farnesol dehydrogenase-like n=1 Tax=Callosobruchus maculatus TaxID=64391 RepID=A0A653C9E6_CALMS|nr:unnamed protein product [Callosobruchus maculatus]